jgi:hypothetical protein
MKIKNLMVEFFLPGFGFWREEYAKEVARNVEREIQSNIAFFSKSGIRQDACDVYFDFCFLFNIYFYFFFNFQ